MILLIEPIESGHHVNLYLKAISKELLLKIPFEIMTTYETKKSKVFKDFMKSINTKIKIHVFNKPKLLKKQIQDSVKLLINFYGIFQLKKFNEVNKERNKLCLC